MKVDLATGWIMPSRHRLSPHCDNRPLDITIDMIVIHNISLPPGQFGTGAIEQFFCNTLDHSQHPFFSTIASLRVSAHLLIDRAGALIQFVPFSKRAWHAGVSCFQERTHCNDFSIGIELEGVDDFPYEKQQYETLAAVIHALQLVYPAITRDRMVGHSDIAPNRKTDPGSAFDWDYLDQLLQRK